jgi:hypothetical protein
MNRRANSGILGGIIWIFVASSVATLLLRFAYDLFDRSPEGELLTLVYSWSNVLLIPVAWLDQYINLPKALPSGFNIVIPIAIGLYVLAGWALSALMPRSRD